MARLGSAVLIALALAGSALAIPVAGTSSAIFANPQGPGGMVTTGVGTSVFSWGTPSPPSPVSSLAFLGTSVSTAVGQPFAFGTLVFFNGTLIPGSEAESVDLVATLMLTLPGVGTHMLTFPLSLVNTPNTASDPNSADFVVFPVSVPPQFFSAGGTQFAVEFLGFGVLGEGSVVVFEQLEVLERQTGTAQLFGRVVTPEPGTFVLLGAGALALFTRRRRRRQAQRAGRRESTQR